MRVERIPIRTITQIGPEGTRTRSLSIYCPFRGRSFSPDQCRDCPKMVAFAENPAAPGASVTCASDDVPDAARAVALHVPDRLGGRFDGVASSTPIGVVMDTMTTAVEDTLAVDELRRELGAATGRIVPVVDHEGRLLGVVAADRVQGSGDRVSTPPPPPSRPELRELFGAIAPSTVREVMVAHVVAFPETGRIRDALNAMIVERVRYLPIVSEDGVLVGLVWDLDLLSWLARAERAREIQR